MHKKTKSTKPDYNTGNHCKYLIQYHIIWCPKFRVSILKNENNVYYKIFKIPFLRIKKGTHSTIFKLFFVCNNLLVIISISVTWPLTPPKG